MRGVVQYINDNPIWLRIINQGKLVTLTAGAQVLIQGIGFISGILIIRILPTHEYALYTLANTMLGIMILLADGGITTGVMAQGGKVWQNNDRLGAVIATGLDLRKKIAIASVLISAPILIFLLHHHMASWFMSCLIFITILPAFYAGLSGTLLEIAPKLRQDVIPLQKIQIGSNIFRLSFLCLSVIAFPFAFVAVIGASISQLWSNAQLRKLGSAYYSGVHRPDRLVRKEIIRIIKFTLPGAIYYCFSGQIAILLTSIAGTTTSVAQLGALGRINMIFGSVSVLFGILISPRFARLQEDRKILFKRFVQIELGLITFCVLILSVIVAFPQDVLWILGKSYSNLGTELVFSITGTCLILISGCSYVLFSSRGWVINPIITILIEISAVAFGILVFDLSTLIGVLSLAIFTGSIQALMNVIYCILKILNVSKELDKAWS
jgi:O-antigen/teichoic acid export membrane protein